MEAFSVGGVATGTSFAYDLHLVDPCVDRELLVQSTIISDFSYVLNLGQDVKDLYIQAGGNIHVLQESSTALECPDIELLIDLSDPIDSYLFTFTEVTADVQYRLTTETT